MATYELRNDESNSKPKFYNKYWFENIFFTIENGDPTLNDKLSKLISTLIKSLVFVANPVIVFDNDTNYLDSYFPHPISPWNFTLYLKPVKYVENDKEKIKWMPSQNPYPIYDASLLDTLPKEIWTGAYGSVVRIPIIEQKDPVLSKNISQQGFFIGSFNIGEAITPSSLLTIESKTQMPIIRDDIIGKYLNDLTKIPDGVYYEVHLVNELQKSLYKYGLTLEQVVADKNKLMNRILFIDLEKVKALSNDCIEILTSNGKIDTSLQPNILVRSYEHTYVIVCYKPKIGQNGKVVNASLDSSEIFVGKIRVKLPKDRTEMHVILIFGTAIYFMTFRVFKSLPFIAFPYLYKVKETNDPSITNDYNIITVNGYTNLITQVNKLVDKIISFTWEGTQNEFTQILDYILPWRIVKCGGEYYVIIQTNISIEGDLVKVSCQADNRYKFFKDWDKIVTDIAPDLCKFEIYPRLPNTHHPPSKIFAFSDRREQIVSYLTKLLKYTYSEQNIDIEEYIKDISKDYKLPFSVSF